MSEHKELQANLNAQKNKGKTSDEKTSEEEVNLIINWVDQIKDESKREQALDELSKKRESVPDLALYIWYSPGTVATLLQEIISTYQLLAPPKLTIEKSNRACSVLALFQCVAAHPETKQAFLAAQIPIFLYPFLNTVNKAKAYEYIRLTALGVIGALVKVDNQDVINFLLNTEIIPLCLRIMEKGSELSKTVACFIVQRILLDEGGLKYICEKAERLFAINTVLSNMVKNNPSQRLIKHIIRSYSRLADNDYARDILITNLPKQLQDKSLYDQLDDNAKKWLTNLLKVLKNTKPPAQQTTNTQTALNFQNQQNLMPQNNNNFNMMLVNQMSMQQQNYIPNDFQYIGYGNNKGYNMGNMANNYYNGFK